MQVKIKENCNTSRPPPVKVKRPWRPPFASRKSSRTAFGTITGAMHNTLIATKTRVPIPSTINAQCKTLRTNKGEKAKKVVVGLSQEANKIPCMKLAHKVSNFFHKENTTSFETSPSYVHNNPLSRDAKEVGKSMRLENGLASPIITATDLRSRQKQCKKGWLEKRSHGLLATWKPKYVVLKKSIFAYYKRENDKMVQFAINFSSYPCNLETDLANSTFTYYSLSNTLFSLIIEIAEKKKFTFRGQDPSDTLEWINTLKLCIKPVLNPIQPPPDQKFWKVYPDSNFLGSPLELLKQRLANLHSQVIFCYLPERHG